jgi:methyl-accepting chemotaxis protein
MQLFRRRHFFIDKQLQTKYILLTIIVLLIYSAVFALLIFLPYILPIHFNAPLAERAEAARILLSLHRSVWPALLVVIPVLGVLSIFITHKIVGPVYRLKQSLRELTAGNLETRVVLRKGDDLQELADHVNQLAETLSDFMTALKHDYDVLSGCIDEMERQVESKSISAEAGREIIQRVNARKQHIESTLERFRTTHQG